MKSGLSELTFHHKALWSQNHCLEGFHRKEIAEWTLWGGIAIPVLVCYCCLWRPWDNSRHLGPECQSPAADQRRLWSFRVPPACVLPSLLGEGSSWHSETSTCLMTGVRSLPILQGQMMDITHSERIVEPKICLQELRLWSQPDLRLVLALVPYGSPCVAF